MARKLEPAPTGAQKLVIHAKCSRIFQKEIGELTENSRGTLMQCNFRTEYPKMLDATVQNLVS